jgi:hypothetical protein
MEGKHMSKPVKFGNTIELAVPSDIWGVTDCVIDIGEFERGRRFHPCGDGSDYRLRDKDIKAIKKLI